jgi:hypothetical protein
VYLGYGVIGGCGLGLGYVSPVSTLIRWFPDRRGMATGMAIMGFGGGALIGTPLKEFLIRAFYRAPEYLGTTDQVDLLTEAGRRFANFGGTDSRKATAASRAASTREGDTSRASIEIEVSMASTTRLVDSSTSPATTGLAKASVMIDTDKARAMAETCLRHPGRSGATRSSISTVVKRRAYLRRLAANTT